MAPFFPTCAIMLGYFFLKEGILLTKKRKAAGAVLGILIVCNLCFIWGNSLLSQNDSGSLSFDVMKLLPEFLHQLIPDTNQLVHLLRKTPHFTEFACLGGLSTGLLAVFRKVKPHPVLHLLSGGFLVAAVDETIQIFSHRGSQLQDVWLDFSGFAVGVAVLLVCLWLFRSRKTA